MKLDAVEKWLDTQIDDLVGLLRDLVAYRTVNPPGAGYDALSARLVAELETAGCTAKRLSVPTSFAAPENRAEAEANPRWNVLARLSGTSETTLHFNAHMDVVPVALAGWRHDPFGGVVEKGWIYGRGTADMKGSIACLLLALRALKAHGLRPARAIEVSFTADEETNSDLGAGWLVAHGGIQPDAVIVMEGGSGHSICCGHNGVVWLEVTVHGKSAHGSTPERGINAFQQMARLALALEDYASSIQETVFTTPAGEVRRPTVNVGGVFGVGDGAKVNTVPGEARFTIDRRVLPIENLETVEAELRAFLEAAAQAIPDCRISVRKISENAPCFSLPEPALFQALAKHVGAVRGERTEFGVSSGFNDMHFFAHQFGVPTAGYGPGGDRFHGDNERALLSDLLACAKIYARLMLEAW